MSTSSVENSGPKQQGKRLSCDRCRGQKLKCVRPSPSGPCQRCTAGKRRCNLDTSSQTTNSPPAGLVDPASASTGMPFIFWQNEMMQPNLPPDYRAEQHHANDTMDMRPHVTGFDSEDALNSILNNVAMGDYDLPNSENPYVTPTCTVVDEAQWPPPQENRESMNHGLHKSTHIDVSNPSTNQQSRRVGLNHSSNVAPMDPSQCISSHNMEPAMAPTQTMNSHPQTPRHQRMYQLMHLGSLMCELQGIYSQDEDALQPINFDAFPTDFAGKVLQAASSFLDILASFSDECCHPPQVSSIVASCTARQMPSQDTEQLPRRASTLDTTYMASSPSSSNTNHRHRRRVYAADKPAVLQLIACYIRFVQIYLLLYTAIYDYVRSNDASCRRRRPIWANLSLGTTSLEAFADFQIRLVLQLAAHVLCEVEAALGLSEGCRVSKKTTAETTGVLGASVTAQFIEMSLTEVSGTEEGRGTIAKLRDIMGRVSGLLASPTPNHRE